LSRIAIKSRPLYLAPTERPSWQLQLPNSLRSFGFPGRDPEDNEVGVYWPTGKSWAQPYGDPIDQWLSEEELLSVLDRMPEMPVV